MINPVCPSDFVTEEGGYKLRFTYTVYCAKHCANWRIGNKKCEEQCNVPECDFDGGDCQGYLQEIDLTNSNFSMYESRRVLRFNYIGKKSV